MMAANRNVLGISPDGEYLASSSPDGTLKVWKTSTGALSQEFVPSSHLSSTCTCITWSPKRHVQGTPGKKKKKRRSSIGSAVQDMELIAMGTTSGNLLLYSVIKGDLHTQLTDGHNDRVNSVCWCDDSSSLYSCSDDHHITEWCLSTASVKQKWKADKNPVYSIALLPDRRRLLSASRAIKLWNLETKEILKTFTGHATEVRWLLPLFDSHQTSSEDALQSYFLSAAVEDRHINVWQTETKSSKKNALASFSLADEPVYLHINPPKEDGQPFLLLVVTRGGHLHIFEHTLNGRLKKPVKPKVNCQVVCEASSSSTPRPIPLLAVHICDGGDRNVLLTYGNTIKPVFESKPYNSFNSDDVLVREDPNRTTLQATSVEVSKIKMPEQSEDLTVLVPGHMGPSKPTSSADHTPSKRKRTKSVDLTMEERINAISIDKPSSEQIGTRPPKADNLATLLGQGLHGNDKKIIQSVLIINDETVIRNTVKKLPVPVIVPLVKELSTRMHGHAEVGHTLIRWVRAVLTIHTSYLMTFPELVNSFSGLYQMIESRVSMFGQLSRLHGKLDLMASQLSVQAQDEEECTSSQAAMMVYQDESSDEELAMKDVIPDNSESEDNWEENEVSTQSDDDNQSEESLEMEAEVNGENSAESDMEQEESSEDD